MGKRGPASLFKPDYCNLAHKFCVLGATNEQLAECFEVSVATISNWLRDFPEFKKAVTEGRMVADADVAERLFAKAKGYDRETSRWFQTPDGPQEVTYIPDSVWETIEGALTDADTELLWAVFGNPTRNTGRFRECFAGGRFAHRWQAEQVDSRSVSITNKGQIAQWVKDYGEDSDFVRVRVRGQFPRAGSMQFIDSERSSRRCSASWSRIP